METQAEKKRILFIEDDLTFRRIFYEQLCDQGYYVVMQQNTEAAKDWALDQRVGQFDMILVDELMPEETGSTFLSFLAELEKADIEKLESRSPLYQSVRRRFSDLGDGEFREFLKNLKVHPGVRVILTGYLGKPDVKKAVEEAIRTGKADKVISKNDGVEAILENIKGLLDQQGLPVGRQ